MKRNQTNMGQGASEPVMLPPRYQPFMDTTIEKVSALTLEDALGNQWFQWSLKDQRVAIDVIKGNTFYITSEHKTSYDAPPALVCLLKHIDGMAFTRITWMFPGRVMLLHDRAFDFSSLVSKLDRLEKCGWWLHFPTELQANGTFKYTDDFLDFRRYPTEAQKPSAGAVFFTDQGSPSPFIAAYAHAMRQLFDWPVMEYRVNKEYARRQKGKTPADFEDVPDQYLVSVTAFFEMCLKNEFGLVNVDYHHEIWQDFSVFCDDSARDYDDTMRTIHAAGK